METFYNLMNGNKLTVRISANPGFVEFDRNNKSRVLQMFDNLEFKNKIVESDSQPFSRKYKNVSKSEIDLFTEWLAFNLYGNSITNNIKVELTYSVNGFW
jgi:uncharacterized protein (DUF1919 family)